MSIEEKRLEGSQHKRVYSTQYSHHSLPTNQQLRPVISALHRWELFFVACHVADPATKHGVNAHLFSEIMFLYDYLEKMEEQELTFPREWVFFNDNTCSQNKANMYHLMAALLYIRNGLADKVTYLYAAIGHTHCIVDQMISTMNRIMAGIEDGVWTPQQYSDICRMIESSRETAPFVVNAVPDLSSFFTWVCFVFVVKRILFFMCSLTETRTSRIWDF